MAHGVDDSGTFLRLVQGDEMDAIQVLIRTDSGQAFGGMARQARLANIAGTDEGNQATAWIGQPFVDLLEFNLPADKRGRLARQVVRDLVLI